MTDFYKSLGISKDATDAEIKKAYRSAANKHHPDKAGGDEVKFKEIKEAYETLSDPNKRSMYDSGHDPSSRFSQQGRAGKQPDFDEVFRHFYGRQQKREEIIAVNVHISLKEAYTGTKKRLDSRAGKTCQTCHGNGFILNQHGEGKICHACNGHAMMHIHIDSEVDIPPGVRSGDKIKIRDVKNDVTLMIVVSVTDDRQYTREGDNLIIEVSVPFYMFIVGGVVEVKHISGSTFSVKIPEKKFDNGDRMRLKGKGMPVSHSSEFGDMYIILCGKILMDVTDTQYELIQKFAEQKETIK